MKYSAKCVDHLKFLTKEIWFGTYSVGKFLGARGLKMSQSNCDILWSKRRPGGISVCGYVEPLLSLEGR